MEGLVLQSTGNDYIVESLGDRYKCHLKGSFKQDNNRLTNPIAVGDYVRFEKGEDGEEWSWITEIMPRKNYIIRRSSNLSKRGQVIGANLDRALLVATINYPITSTTFIDRFLATCEAYSVAGGIVFNKIDRYNKPELEELWALMDLYESIGYKARAISAYTREGIDDLMELISDGVTLLSGHSGVGKSSLINVLIPNADRKIAEISEANNAGVHTTTHSEMIALPSHHGAYIIDTPGVRGFGTLVFEKEDVGHYFPEIFRLSKECKFYNCTHTHEPECAVLRGLKTGRISPTRYKSYLSIFSEDEDEKYRAPY